MCLKNTDRLCMLNNCLHFIAVNVVTKMIIYLLNWIILWYFWSMPWLYQYKNFLSTIRLIIVLLSFLFRFRNIPWLYQNKNFYQLFGSSLFCFLFSFCLGILFGDIKLCLLCISLWLYYYICKKKRITLKTLLRNKHFKPKTASNYSKIARYYELL
jgi:hypothetical protein